MVKIAPMSQAIEKLKMDYKAVELAAFLDISPAAVSKWDEIPTDRVLAVSEFTNWKMTPHQFRPDIYPHPQDGLPEHMRHAA
jgi:DNA-binding transcriptional regulator YdaS (Cro superfamily)